MKKQNKIEGKNDNTRKNSFIAKKGIISKKGVISKEEKELNIYRIFYFVVGTALYFAMLILFFVAQKQSNVIHNIKINMQASDKYYVGVLSPDDKTINLKMHTVSNMSINKDSEINQLLNQYKDKDHYNLQSDILECSGPVSFGWENEGKDTYKFILYFPEEKAYMISSSLESFSSVCNYILNISSIKDEESIIPISYYSSIYVILSFLLQIGMIVWIKLGLGYIFKYREKKQKVFISVTSLIVQLIAGFYLLGLGFRFGFIAWLAGSILLRIFICLFNVFMYIILLPILTGKEKREWKDVVTAIVYVVVSDLICSLLQMLLFVILPGVY